MLHGNGIDDMMMMFYALLRGEFGAHPCVLQASASDGRICASSRRSRI